MEKNTNNLIIGRQDVLDAARFCICGKRDEDYGSPEHNFDKISRLWNSYLGDNVTDAHDVAMMMALLKIARAKAGTHLDNYVDIAGYAACAGEIVASKEMRG